MDTLQRLLAFYRMENPFEKHDNNYWRVRLINVFLILTTFVYLFFTLFNLTVTHLYANATIDIIGLVTIHAILFNYHHKGRVDETSHYITISVFILSAAVIMVAKKDYGILFWSIFLPIFAMMLMGRRMGLYYSITYYAILIVHLVSDLGEEVTLHIIIEFTIVSAVLVALIYFYESSRIQAYELLEHKSQQDPLTTLYNRRYFNTAFTAEFNHLKRLGEPFSFFIMDIDHFKRYNDNYGHPAGDRVLRAIANTLNAHLRRSGEISFRLGGEEFGAIVNGQENDETTQHLERIRRAIEGLAIEHRGNEAAPVVTASFGLVVVNNYEGLTHERVYQLADEALYRAKEAGRNQVESIVI